MVLDAFLAGLAVVVAGIVFAAVRGIGLWREAKRTGAVFTTELASFEDRAALAERHLAELESSSRDLELALERLRVSQARLRVLLDAVERARHRVRWLRVLVPR